MCELVEAIAAIVQAYFPSDGTKKKGEEDMLTATLLTLACWLFRRWQRAAKN